MEDDIEEARKRRSSTLQNGSGTDAFLMTLKSDHIYQHYKLGLLIPKTVRK